MNEMIRKLLNKETAINNISKKIGRAVFLESLKKIEKNNLLEDSDKYNISQ